KTNIKSILVLGMGSGYFISSFIKLLPHLKNIDIVEIDPDVIEVAQKYFDFEQNDHININIQDARVFVRNSKSKYDLIIMDLASHEGLFYRFMTEEFLYEVRERLNPDGILASNLFGSPDFRHDNNLVFNSVLKTYKAVYDDVLIFPTIYGNYEFYKKTLGFKHELSDLTNIILFASNRNFNATKDKLVSMAVKLKESYNFTEINKIDKYAADLCEFNINLDNFSALKDEWEDDPQFNIDNLKNYLYIDHLVNNQVDKINPVDDERKSVKS
ncbi:MAG: fused MFS/spermidine synthase, partial [Candidatus Gastranaerophilales bacterium]|nr:fused MFS/spermidine synthase [Candidatus Gastranaerophilales bacterium]